jgi:hypothetical protein
MAVIKGSGFMNSRSCREIKVVGETGPRFKQQCEILHEDLLYRSRSGVQYVSCYDQL